MSELLRRDVSELAGKLVVFPDGQKIGMTGCIYWDVKAQNWFTLQYNDDGYPATDDDGKAVRIYAVEVIDKPVRKRKPFVPGKHNCPVEIFPLAETEKAYQVPDGSNGKIGRSSVREYYKYIAKSVCYVDEEGRIFAPVWATR